jgi:hypothetical protein
MIRCEPVNSVSEYFCIPGGGSSKDMLCRAHNSLDRGVVVCVHFRSMVVYRCGVQSRCVRQQPDGLAEQEHRGRHMLLPQSRRFGVSVGRSSAPSRGPRIGGRRHGRDRSDHERVTGS